MMKPQAVFLFLVFLCCALYFNSLGNGFIFDDRFLIIDNYFIKDIRYLPRIFATDIFAFRHQGTFLAGGYYRPLQSLTHMVDYAFWKMNPVGYRLTNLFLHSLNAFFLYLLAVILFKKRFIAFLGAVFFCVHPIQTSVVAFISVRSVLLEVFFVLLCLILALRFFGSGRKAHYGLSLLFFLGALLCREDALLVPLFIALCGLVFGVRLRRLAIFLLPFVLIAVGYLIMRSIFMPSPKLTLSGAFSLRAAGDFFYYLVDYFRQLVFPTAVFGNGLLSQKAFLIFSSFFFAALCIAAAFARDRKLSFAVALYCAALLPMARLGDNAKMLGTVLSEHYAYLASAGFSLAAASLLARLKPEERGRKTGLLLLGGLCLLYCGGTVFNTVHYRNEIAFYKHLLSLDEKHTFTRVNLGTAYYGKKMYAQAAEEAWRVLEREPNAWDAYLLLGNVLKSLGRQEEAIVMYQRAHALNPLSALPLNNMALISKSRGEQRQAYEYFKGALEIEPASTLVLNNFARFLLERGERPQAALLSDCALRIDPGDPAALVTKGIISAQEGNTAHALAYFNRALRRDPASTDALMNLGVLYANMGDLDKAVSFWGMVLRISPGDAAAKANIEAARKLRKGS